MVHIHVHVHSHPSYIHLTHGHLQFVFGFNPYYSLALSIFSHTFHVLFYTSWQYMFFFALNVFLDP